MGIGESPIQEIVRRWIAEAEIDWRTAESLVQDVEPIRVSIAFHCLPAAEKYLKAFLVSRQVEFPKTHSIAQLLDLPSTAATELAASPSSALVLTPFGVEIRYPGDFPELLPGEERMLFDLAAQFRTAILPLMDRLPDQR